MKLSKSYIFVLVLGLFLWGGWSQAYAQLKIRYIDTERIVKEFPEFQEAQKQLDELRQTYETEFKQMQEDAQRMLDEMQNQSLLMSPEKKAEMENKLRQLQAKMEQYYYEKLGPQGEIYQKNQELTQPIIDKINKVIKKIGDEEEYDYVLDVAQGVVLYAKPEYNITDRVLEELNKAQ
ncbi:MAG: hypothetical protein GWN16_06925 [Calditrichae bacterium]|nr:hypothetical protein [Calditrichia bacterium]